MKFERFKYLQMELFDSVKRTIIIDYLLYYSTYCNWNLKVLHENVSKIVWIRTTESTRETTFYNRYLFL